MIATRNRLEDLRRTCENIRTWSPAPDEVIICADGCTDDTVKMVRDEFSMFTLIENIESLGSVGSRNRILHLAKSEFVVSLDDDSYPLDPSFLERIRKVLDEHLEAGVITFPELRNDGEFGGNMSPSSSGHYVAAYPNCAAVMRRELYLKSKGFPTFFHHMYEETDYALQCYAADSPVWFEPSQTIRHHLSLVQRQPIRRHHQNARNELWSVWLRCPFPWLIPVSIFRIVRQFQYACTEGFDWVIREPIWWWLAIVGLPQCMRDRQPIKWKIYYAWMKLARNPISDLAQLKQTFWEGK
jgi:GT2 family glycosyltransferase